jgi:hypothetical protein
MEVCWWAVTQFIGTEKLLISFQNDCVVNKNKPVLKYYNMS